MMDNKELEEVILEADINEASKEQLRKWSVHILKKRIMDRTEKDHNVVKKFTRGIKFFKDIIENPDSGIETFDTLCENLEYEYLERDQTLFEAGSTGTTFYIILEGTVDVIVNLMKLDEDGLERLTPTKVAKIPAGASFGELAIMEETKKPRKATIRSSEDTDCHFATLTREVFQSTLSHIRKAHDEAMEVFVTNPVFSQEYWTKNNLQKLIKLFQPLKNLHRGTQLFKEGDDCDLVYWVRTGEVVSSKTVKIPTEANFQKDFILDEKNQMYHLGQNPIIRTCEINYWQQSSLIGEDESLRSWEQEQQVEAEEIRLKKHFMKVIDDEKKKKMREGFKYRPSEGIVLPKNQQEEEKMIRTWVNKELDKQFPEKVYRLTNVTVSSSVAEIWVCDKKNFFPKVTRNSLSYGSMMEIIQTKNERRIERVQELVRSAVQNLEFLNKKVITKIDKDFPKLLKQNKANKAHKNEKIIFESNQKSYKQIQDALDFIEEGKRLRCLPSNELVQKKVDHSTILQRDTILRKSLLLNDSQKKINMLHEKRASNANVDETAYSPTLKPITLTKGPSQITEFDLDLSPGRMGKDNVQHLINLEPIPSPKRRITRDYERKQTRDNSPMPKRGGHDLSLDLQQVKEDVSKSSMMNQGQFSQQFKYQNVNASMNSQVSIPHQPINRHASSLSPNLKQRSDSEYSGSITKPRHFDFKKPKRDLPSLNLSLLNSNIPSKEDNPNYQKGKKMLEDALEARSRPRNSSHSAQIEGLLGKIPGMRNKFNGKGKKTLVVNNPVKGLSYTTNMNGNLSKYTEKTLGTSNRMTSKPEVELDYDGERFMSNQIKLKSRAKNKLLKGNAEIKNDFNNPLFDIKELKASHEELMDDINKLMKQAALDKFGGGSDEDKKFLKSLVTNRSRDYLKEGNQNSVRYKTHSQTTPRTPRDEASPISKTQPTSPHEQIYRQKVKTVSRKNSIHNADEGPPSTMYMGGPNTPHKSPRTQQSSSPLRQMNLQRLLMRRVSANDAGAATSNMSSPRDLSAHGRSKLSDHSRNLSGFSPAKRKEYEQAQIEKQAKAALFKDEVVPYNMRLMAGKYQRAQVLFRNIMDSESRYGDDDASTGPTNTLNPKPSRPFFSHVGGGAMGVNQNNPNMVDFTDNTTHTVGDQSATQRGILGLGASEPLDMPDHSNRIANMLDNQNNKYEKPIIATQGFFPRHKALIKGDNNVYNRMAVVEKAEVLARRNKLPTIVKRRNVPQYKLKVQGLNSVNPTEKKKG